MRRLWLTALALTILLPALAALLVLSVVGQSRPTAAPACSRRAVRSEGVPSADIPIFESAGAEFGLGARGPSILAAINDVESTFGTSTLPGVHSGTNSAGAAGPMQIGIGGRAGDTWDRVKVNAPGDPPGRPPNVYDEADAVYSAAHYLQESGAPDDWPGAIFAYNHSAVYVQQVLARASGYDTQGLAASSRGTGIDTSSPTAPAHRFRVPAAPHDPAGPIALAPGQPMLVAATEFSDRTGAWATT